MMAGTLRMISWDESADERSSTNDADSSDEDDPEILKLVRQRVYYPPSKTIARTMQLANRNIQRTKAMILGEPLVQISRMVDSLEPPQTLYEGTTPLLARYSDKKHYYDITDLPKSLLTSTKEVRLLRLGAEASSLEPPGRFEAETDVLGIKIATKEVPWQDVCDGITPEEHMAIREEDAQMMATVFSWRSGHSFISAPPPDLTKQANTKQIDVRIWDQLYELHVSQYVPDAIRQWVRCPMGICNAPSTFQRAMNMTFKNFVNKTRLTQGMINFYVIIYMDDILVYSETYHGHVQHIEWTLGALRDAGFKIALEKSEFFLSEISFLGYVVTRGGLRPDSRKAAAVKEAPVPTSLTQVRAFLGLAPYYRRFIKGFVVIARPLTNLLRKDQPLNWDAECQHAFATLKDTLATAPILIRPDSAKQFILIMDWQPEAISAILAQKGNKGLEHVIEFASRTVPDQRRNDSASQGECYAVVWGIQHFHPYLYGQKFRLVTDHEPLLALKKLTNYTGMIGRWAVRLQEYDCKNTTSISSIERQSDTAWRTSVEGELLAFLFGTVRPGHKQLIAQELAIPVAQLADELPLDIISQDGEHPIPHVLSRTLTPYLQWSACVEGAAERIPPSQQQYLDPQMVCHPAFFRHPTAGQLAAIREEEEEEESTESDEGEDEREESGESDEVLEEEDETPEEGSYSEHSEGEQSEEEEEEDEGEEENEAGPMKSEWETAPEEALRTGTEAEDPEAARKRKETAAGKRELEVANGASLHVHDDPNQDPEPPRPEHGDLTATTPTPSMRRRSRSPSSPTRPPVRRRTDTGDRPSSPITLPPSS
ncbi:hypothetical protein CBR_g58406 [Chara braunii]|uniref:Reverse transcriptase domain-containing protein n=1 Tax=Chara braunii TaxID=69332 RepID=A0A388MES1_CHABU|nr:hypothetical protein CBR_g58406 [Chara braunii]|eukprot:GBG93051.1 hypothetical protein CBR_g58406 [Chara braunii]